MSIEPNNEHRIKAAKASTKRSGTEKDLQFFNDVLYNAGFSFMVEMLNQNQILIFGSFDLIYYIQLHIYFDEICFTNLSDKSMWPDAWYDEQLVVHSGEQRTKILRELGIDISDDCQLFQFKSLVHSNPNSLIVAAKSMRFAFIS